MFIENKKTLVRDKCNIPKLRENGLTDGNIFNIQEGVIIDPGHCWLILIGKNVTLTPRVHFLRMTPVQKCS